LSIDQQIQKKASNTFSQLSTKLIDLEGNLASHIAISHERTKKMDFQLECKREQFQEIKARLVLANNRLKQIEDALGCYTGNDKLDVL
jgi:hypothetical protein